MYALLSMITLGPEKSSAAEKLADQFAPDFKTLKGFKRETFLGDDRVGEYWALSLWESKEDAETALADVSPQLEQAVSGIAKEPPTHRIFRVYEPKA